MGLGLPSLPPRAIMNYHALSMVPLRLNYRVNGLMESAALPTQITPYSVPGLIAGSRIRCAPEAVELMETKMGASQEQLIV